MVTQMNCLHWLLGFVSWYCMNFVLMFSFISDIQPPDFDGQEVTLKLHRDGHLGSFEGSSGKIQSWDIVLILIVLTPFLEQNSHYSQAEISRQHWFVTPLTGKSYDIVSFASQHPDATVFSSSTSKTETGKLHMYLDYICYLYKFYIYFWAILIVL